MAASAFFFLRINDHILYLKKIQMTLEGSGDFRGTDFHSCKPGQWVYGEGAAEADALSPEARAIFDELIEPHRQFHDASQAALERQQGGDVDGAQQAITEMHNLSTALVNKLVQLDRFKPA